MMHDDTDDDDTVEPPQIGPLQVAVHVVQNRHAGEQKSHWDKTNKGNNHLKLCMLFICLVPVRILLSSMAVLYSGEWQAAI